MMTNRFVKSLAVVLVLATAALATSQNAYAGRGTRNFVFGALAGVAGLAALDSLSRGRYYDRSYGYYNTGYRSRRHNYNNRRYYRPNYRYGYRNYSRPRYRTYYAPRHRPAYRARPAYRGRPAAWSPAWYRYCANKYRSFRRSDGTFQPYNGGRRICR